MIKSMTGYGKAQITINDKIISIELKSLNSKQADINLKLPSQYRAKDILIRNKITACLERGKVDCYIHTEYTGQEQALDINSDLFVTYYKQLEKLADSVNANKDDLMRYVLQIPEVSRTINEDISQEEEDSLIKVLDEVLLKIEEFRVQEGQVLANDFRKRIEIIGGLLLDIDKHEQGRVEKIKEKIQFRLIEVAGDKIDNNRLEQELIYYIEKLDVTEEKIRLRQHLNYFIETMEHSKSEGKKLSFIVQEIGREINTLGSKSNEAGMQQVVVKMKDELEKIKEQILNVL